ncbi:TraR/DksA C4-type zinc finger protein [Pseudomonas sp. LFM046]|uniref:TraR/DksA C4-type zinc finger protein n=1 Tax=Pseudomonas sp. LFM046 TaxID=1608357 RepID=UPI0005CFB773|nr:TraR/DksA C4-type zinc finger protein [Pseudomonas sp. LFM046]
MVDLVDMANEVAELRLNEALERQRREGNVSAVSAEFCEDCDDAIPEPRRLALPGVQTCVECQGLREVRRA